MNILFNIQSFSLLRQQQRQTDKNIRNSWFRHPRLILQGQAQFSDGSPTPLQKYQIWQKTIWGERTLKYTVQLIKSLKETKQIRYAFVIITVVQIKLYNKIVFHSYCILYSGRFYTNEKCIYSIKVYIRVLSWYRTKENCSCKIIWRKYWHNILDKENRRQFELTAAAAF
jgi:hypothetical protein